MVPWSCVICGVRGEHVGVLLRSLSMRCGLHPLSTPSHQLPTLLATLDTHRPSYQSVHGPAWDTVKVSIRVVEARAPTGARPARRPGSGTAWTWPWRTTPSRCSSWWRPTWTPCRRARRRSTDMPVPLSVISARLHDRRQCTCATCLPELHHRSIGRHRAAWVPPARVCSSALRPLPPQVTSAPA